MLCYGLSVTVRFLVLGSDIPKAPDSDSLLEKSFLMSLVVTSGKPWCLGTLGNSGLHLFLPAVCQQALKSRCGIIYYSRLASPHPRSPPAIISPPHPSFKISSTIHISILMDNFHIAPFYCQHNSVL